MGIQQYSCVLWDVDGTIADASAGILPRIATVLAGLGKPPTPADRVHEWIGPPMLESFQTIAGLTADEALTAVTAYRTLASSHGYAESVRLYDGIADVIHDVALAGTPQSTASTKPQNQVQAIFEHFGITDLFVAVHGARPEPDAHDTKADVLGRALDDLASRGIDLSKPVLIGDRHHDVDGATDHDVPVIFARWGFGSSAEEAGAQHVVDTPAELRVLLLGHSDASAA
ncbi:MAG: HAD hydrolase-like protein [Microbacterium gubbeenense]|uniref:HAD hydrolase-like protein n=1 Tax=Microbacterium gubbeenense TaxID=159896 RepID=UPI003F952C2B